MNRCHQTFFNSQSSVWTNLRLKCSAKTDSLSLNDAIFAGPKLQKDLFDVLIWFRMNPIAFTCDIKEMYLQVEIEQRDCPYFRLLWRDLDSSCEPDIYELSRVVFGKNSAPMEAQFVAQENARRHQDVYPSVAETVLKSTYMDDSIDMWKLCKMAFSCTKS